MILFQNIVQTMNKQGIRTERAITWGVQARVFDSERETYQFTVCTNIQITKVKKKRGILSLFI